MLNNNNLIQLKPCQTPGPAAAEGIRVLQDSNTLAVSEREKVAADNDLPLFGPLGAKQVVWWDEK